MRALPPGGRTPRLGPLGLAVLVWTVALVHASTAAGGSPEERPVVNRVVPAPAPPGVGGFAFLVPTPDGGGAAFDPCRPVHWVLRPDGEPLGGRAVVERAVGEVSRATGLRFVFDGTTDEPPVAERPRRLPERYGDRWAPVLVAWASEREVPELAGARVGSGKTSWVEDEGLRLVSGSLVLDREDLTQPDGVVGPLAAGTALHELAHVVGLGHVDDPTQLMHPVVHGTASFGDGDRRGLHALGSVGCRDR